MKMNKIRIFSGAAALLMGISLCACTPSKVEPDEQSIASQTIDLPEYTSNPESPNVIIETAEPIDSQSPDAEKTQAIEEYDLSTLLVAKVKTGQTETKYIMEEIKNDFESYDREDGAGKIFINDYSYRAITDSQVTYKGRYIMIEDIDRKLQSMNNNEIITTSIMKIENEAYLTVSDNGNPYADCKIQITDKDGHTYTVDTGEQYFVEIYSMTQIMEVEPGTIVTTIELRELEETLNLDIEKKVI